MLTSMLCGHVICLFVSPVNQARNLRDTEQVFREGPLEIVFPDKDASSTPPTPGPPTGKKGIVFRFTLPVCMFVTGLKLFIAKFGKSKRRLELQSYIPFCWKYALLNTVGCTSE